MQNKFFTSKIILPVVTIAAAAALIAPINIVAIAQEMMQYPNDPFQEDNKKDDVKTPDNPPELGAEDENTEGVPAEEPKPKEAEKKPVLKDAGGYSGYDSQTYEQDISSADAAIIAATPHRKREIEPGKKQRLVELSKILGELHALRVSCVGAGDQTYRSKMSNLLDIEAPSAEYIRDPLIIAFNSGFEAMGQGQRACPNDNGKKEASYAKKGRNISLEMAKIYRTAIDTNTQPKF